MEYGGSATAFSPLAYPPKSHENLPALSPACGVYLYMQLLLEQNRQHSRNLFFACLLIGAALSPIVLHLVDRSMSDLHPAHTKPQPSPDSKSPQWDIRSM